MINLLSPAAKKEFAAGRVNALLIRYLWIIAALFILMTAIGGLTYLMLDNIKTNAVQQIAENEQHVTQYQSVQVRADEFKSNLAIAKTIMDRQTYYSDAILRISKYLPPGTVINTISLDGSSYGTPMTLQVYAVDETAAIALKTSFQNSQVFSDVQFQSLSLGGSGGNTSYGVNVTLKVTISKEGIGNESF